MKRHSTLCGALMLLAAAAPLTAGAQERGRTDGPEESEYGKGGYADPGGRGVSLQLDWARPSTPRSRPGARRRARRCTWAPRCRCGATTGTCST